MLYGSILAHSHMQPEHFKKRKLLEMDNSELTNDITYSSISPMKNYSMGMSNADDLTEDMSKEITSSGVLKDLDPGSFSDDGNDIELSVQTSKDIITISDKDVVKPTENPEEESIYPNPDIDNDPELPLDEVEFFLENEQDEEMNNSANLAGSKRPRRYENNPYGHN